jgi:catechol 2,3-dioxygenase-like lactoylglutathione lyase family enzyme
VNKNSLLKLVVMATVLWRATVFAGQAKITQQNNPAMALRVALDETSRSEAPALEPSVYHHVAQVVWVVSNIDRVADYWQHLGIRDIQRDGVVKFVNLTYRGKPDRAEAKQVTARVGELEIKWIQPVRGGKFWKDALQQRGDGIRAVAYKTRSSEEFDGQIKYFASKGVGVVVEDSWQGKSGRGRIAYLDTATQGGGNTLALIDDPDARQSAQGAGNEYPLAKITHFAWVVNDVRKVDAYYTSLGFKSFSAIDHNISLDRVYRGQPGTFEMWLGWDRTGDAPLEWVQQITGPDVYVEYGKKHGEGFHHLGVNVNDMDEAVKLMTARGAPAAQDASWKASKGKGRAVYLDTDPQGGVTLELIYDPH